MKKGLKTAGIMALSAVLACGALGALAGCGGGGGGGGGATGNPTGDADTLTVSIFCNAADATTNQAICDAWAAEYSAAHSAELGGKKIKVSLSNNPDKTNYFEDLKRLWSTGTTADIIYLAPRYVKSYAERGNILDLSGYLSADQLALTQDVWQNGISYYGYIKGQRNNYRMGRAITQKDGKFVTADGEDAGTQVGLYGLPKDYSNFSTGYNRLFFSDTLKNAYQTTKPNSGTSVKAPKGEGAGELTSKLTYTHNSSKDNCIQYAASGTNPKTNETFSAGDPANIINVGIPTTYYPYNFFRFSDYRSARDGGDPVALMSHAMGGYTVTIPGFPNDELKISEESFKATYGTNADFDGIDVPYNKNIGHVTYTYAEYGALLWAVTYYLNTHAWDTNNDGYGGRTFSDGSHQTVYGGEQYEGIAGAAGSVMYLLPWLAANDADLINEYSTLTSQTGRPNGVSDTAISDPSDWRSVAGHATYQTTKRTLADTTATKNVQYGHNSENFIETYAAFLAIGSDWNVNPSGDTDSTDRANNGWAYFRSGRSICYGAGSWDAATRNDVNASLLDFGQMPMPISEKYAIYSEIKDANYQKAYYANDPAAAAAGSTDEAKQLTGNALTNAKTQVYDSAAILKNQIRRQDKWAARMDTVGYAVAAKTANYPEAHAWKRDAAIDLTARLTINKDAQKTLLYAGAQLPNFVSQCKEFVDYKGAGANGTFNDMLTPEGFADTATAAEGKQIWDAYYDLAEEMEKKAQRNEAQTVDEFLSGKQILGEAVRYDKSNYGSKKFSEFTGDGNSRLAYAMKVLKMVAFRADDRDINIRMQYGLNAVRDSSMYTYDDKWLASIDARTSVNMLAYSVKSPLTAQQRAAFLTGSNGVYTSKFIQMNPAQNTNPDGAGWSYMTPAVWCLKQSEAAQTLLTKAMGDELDAMTGNK